MRLWLAEVLHTLEAVHAYARSGQNRAMLTAVWVKERPIASGKFVKSVQSRAAAATPYRRCCRVNKYREGPRKTYLSHAIPCPVLSCAVACARGAASVPNASPTSLRKSPRRGAAEGAPGSQDVPGAHCCRPTPLQRLSPTETLPALRSLLHGLRAGAISVPESNPRVMIAPHAARLHPCRGRPGSKGMSRSLGRNVGTALHLHLPVRSQSHAKRLTQYMRCHGCSCMLQNSRCTLGHALELRLHVDRLRAQCCLCVCQLGSGKVRSLPCPV